jgi:hypothetical protein
MAMLPQFTRPGFTEALNAWKKLLAERQLPTDLIWLFDENLCFEKDPASNNGFSLRYQTQLTPAPPDADRVAFNYFSDFEARLVIYRVGSARGKSVCVLLCDEWFEAKNEKQGFIRRDEWLMSFYPGTTGEIEEITDERRWKARILRDRPLHDLDFCMSLRSVHEMLAHGRVLTAYEHYALKFLHGWRRLLRGHPE